MPRKKNPEFAVIGLGRFGRAVAMTLAERGLTVVGIDRDQRIVQNLSEDITQTMRWMQSTKTRCVKRTSSCMKPSW